MSGFFDHNFSKPASPGKCSCRKCSPDAWLVLACRKCGDKRCPQIKDHRNDCAGRKTRAPDA